MSFIIKPTIVLSEFVIKCTMASLFLLFIIGTLPLLLPGNVTLSIISDCLLLTGLSIFVRSILWDLFGKEIVTISEQKLTIERILPFSKKSISISIEDITSIDCTQYAPQTDNDVFFKSISFFRYLRSIVSLNRGYIFIQTIYRSYQFCPDIQQREFILDRLKDINLDIKSEHENHE